MSADNLAKTNSEVGTPAKGDEGGNFPPFDTGTFASQLLWLAITFGIFYYVMSKTVLPRISEILEVRSDRIAQDLETANELKRQSDEAFAAYEQELAEARGRAHSIAQDARDKAKSDADAERLKVETQLSNKLAEAESKIAAIKNAALAEVGTIAEDTSSALVKELLGGKLTKAEVASAVKLADTNKERSDAT